MTSNQRAVLQAMGASWRSTADIVSRSGMPYRKVRQCLYLLQKAGHVDHETGRWRVTPKGEAPQRRAAPARKPTTRRKLKAKPFRPRPDATRYGQLFQIVRVLRCWLCVEGYQGPGHTVGNCAIGVQGKHTAHHVGRLDEEGLIPGGGAAHDLYAGLGGKRTVAHFRKWLKERGLTLEEVGQMYVAKARAIIARGSYGDEQIQH